MENERGSERERQNQEVIAEAVRSLDAYDSERARAASQELERSNDESYIVKLPDRKLTFFGSYHTNNPDSSTIKKLRADLRETLSTTNPGEIVFMVEGKYAGIDTEKAVEEMSEVTSLEEAIKRHGESGVALWIVAEYQRQDVEVKITSPEKPEHEIVDTLKRDGFSGNDIVAYLSLRQISQYLRKDGQKMVRAAILDRLARESYDQQLLTGSDWIKDFRPADEILQLPPQELEKYKLQVAGEAIEGLNTWLRSRSQLDHDVVNLEAILEQDESAVSMADVNEFQDPLDEAGRGSQLNAVAASWNTERDKYLIEQIGKAMAAGKKPYVIYGASHATHCEPALEKLANIV